ncbi:hypothetical protein GF406_27100 [candidate division KSB1 bacterium]|nr:hypothetical protein [candidate division KSB1 bacterium]
MAAWPELLNQDLSGVSEQSQHIRQNISTLARQHDHVMIYGEPGVEMLSVARILVQQSGLPANSDEVLMIQSRELNRVSSSLSSWLAAFDGQRELILVLDQVQDLSPETQQDVLEILQRFEQRQPSPGALFVHHLRLVSTAFPQLITLVAEKKFNADLFGRISRYSLKVPALRERPEDIPILFEQFALQQCRERDMSLPDVSFDLIRALLTHPWPENLIELKQAAMDWVNGIHTGVLPSLAVPTSMQKVIQGEIIELPMLLADMERELLQRALEKFNGHQRLAARALGIAESLLRYKMKKYDLYRHYTLSRGRPRKA